MPILGPYTILSSSTALTTGTDAIWDYWMLTGDTTATATATTWNTTDIVWRSWQPQTPIRVIPVVPYQTPVLTDEERLRIEQAAAERRAIHAQELIASAERRNGARERATQLLMAHLDEEQQKDFEQEAAFTVRAPSGRAYRLHLGWAGNVEGFDTLGRRHGTYCIHPSIQVPYEDNMLAQKLLIEHNEEEFQSIANYVRAAA